MNLYLIRNKRSFGQYNRVDGMVFELNTDGYAGDAWMCGLVNAKNSKDAWQLFQDGLNTQIYDEVKPENYEIEAIESNDSARLIMRAYGQY